MNREGEGDGSRHISSARASVREAQRLLVRPTPKSVEESAASIRSAVQSLGQLRNGVRRDPAVTAEIVALRKEIAVAAALLDGAATFYLGWARLLYTAAGGYTASGEPARPGRVRRISVEG
jgi:hypothetical protein